MVVYFNGIGFNMTLFSFWRDFTTFKIYFKANFRVLRGLYAHNFAGSIQNINNIPNLTKISFGTRSKNRWKVSRRFCLGTEAGLQTWTEQEQNSHRVFSCWAVRSCSLSWKSFSGLRLQYFSKEISLEKHCVDCATTLRLSLCCLRGRS